MVFLAKGAKTYKLKIRIPTRPAKRTFSTGTTVKAVADDVEAMVKRFVHRRKWAALEVVFDGLATLAEVYDAEVNDTLDELITRLRDVDLEPLVSDWAKKANPKYVRQVRRFIVEGTRFPATGFRRKAISAFLAGLSCDDPTRNRYRAALSAFAKWLVEREVLDRNPVRDVAMYKENDPRMVWMTWKDAARVADAAPDPYRTLFAVMAGTGIELGAALRLVRTDVTVERVKGQRDVYTIHARGSKTTWRNRVVRVEDWCQHYLAHRINELVGPVLLFPLVAHMDALDTFKSAQAAVGITGHRLHDLRHTYAVNALKQGYKPQVVAHQLGHKDASMVIKCYGRFIPTEADYTVTEPVKRSDRR